MEIRSKAEFFRLWEAGVLGNKLRTWRDPRDAAASDAAVVGLRQIGVAGGGKFEMSTNRDIVDTSKRWVDAGLSFVVCEAAPDEKGTIQGEVCRTFRGLEGLLGFSNGLRMRDAIAQGKLLPRSGATVLALLDTYMDASSRSDLDDLLDLYPDATVEFTCYSCLVGALPGRNTIFWEVRNY